MTRRRGLLRDPLRPKASRVLETDFDHNRFCPRVSRLPIWSAMNRRKMNWAFPVALAALVCLSAVLLWRRVHHRRKACISRASLPRTRAISLPPTRTTRRLSKRTQRIFATKPRGIAHSPRPARRMWSAAKTFATRGKRHRRHDGVFARVGGRSQQRVGAPGHSGTRKRSSPLHAPSRKRRFRPGKRANSDQSLPRFSSNPSRTNRSRCT